MFSEKDKSTFPYWFAHWCAFQMTALNLGCWKFKYLFHDIEKPWLKLFMSYSKVQKWHRQHNKHHTSYRGGLDKVDWQALIIDNECSRFTKSQAPMTAREWVEYCINDRYKDDNIMREAYQNYAIPMLEKLSL